MFRYELLKQYLEKNGVKKKCFADKVGIQEAILNSILTGERKCGLAEYVNICNSLGVPFESFIFIKLNEGKH